MKQLLQGVVVAIARLLHLLVKKQEAIWLVRKGRPQFKTRKTMLPKRLRCGGINLLGIGENMFGTDLSSESLL